MHDNVWQHAATREDLTQMLQEFDAKFDRLDTKIGSLHKGMNANTWKLLVGLTVIIAVFSFLTQALATGASAS